MKFLDETFGPIVCFFFYWFNSFYKIALPQPQVIDKSKVRNILLIKFFGMGSIVLATPLMRLLKANYPQARLIILTFACNKEICERISHIDEVVTVKTSSLLRFLSDSIKAIIYLRRKKCEISMDLEFFSKSSTLVQYLCGSNTRVGYYIIQRGYILKMLWRGNLLTHNVYYNPHRHITEVFLALANTLGDFSDDLSLTKLSRHPDDHKKLAALEQTGTKLFQKYVVLNINSSSLCFERRWPLENYARLACRLANDCGVKIIVIGSEQDTDYVSDFMRKVDKPQSVVNLAGKLDLGMLAGLLESAAVFITNDSGPLHLAVSLGCPTVSFFGPEIPERFGPVGDEHIVFYSGVYCSPCLNVSNQKSAPCRGKNICMTSIPFEKVWETIMARHFPENTAGVLQR